MYVYTHTYTHAGGARGAFGPPPATTPPIVKVGTSLYNLYYFTTAYIHSNWILANASPTGGVVAGGGPKVPLAPPRARARVCVCVPIFLLKHTWCGKFILYSWNFFVNNYLINNNKRLKLSELFRKMTSGNVNRKIYIFRK